MGASLLEPLVMTLAEQIAEAQRELALRRQCYPHGIRDGKLDSRTAYDQLQAMEAIVKTLQKLDIEQWQLSLCTSHHKDPA